MIKDIKDIKNLFFECAIIGFSVSFGFWVFVVAFNLLENLLLIINSITK